MICYLDLDGVLAQFVPAVIELFGSKIKETDVKSYDYYTYLGVSEAEVWQKVKEEKDFWVKLKKYPWANELVGYLERNWDISDLVLCTKSSPDPYSAANKITWIQTNFPKLRDHYVVCRLKGFLSSENALLIDDCEKNVYDFQEQGGSTVLFPQPWNNYARQFEIRDKVEKDIYDKIISLITKKPINWEEL